MISIDKTWSLGKKCSHWSRMMQDDTLLGTIIIIVISIPIFPGDEIDDGGHCLNWQWWHLVDIKNTIKKIPGTQDTTSPLLLWCVIVVVVVAVYSTIPFHSICWSPITGPQKSMKCHNGHGHFGEVTKYFFDSKKYFKIEIATN